MSHEIALTKDVNNLLAEVDRLTANIPDAETARQMVARVIGLEEALKQMDHYHWVACKMAEAEVLLYVRICEQGMGGKLKGKRHNICEWVAGMTPEERAALIDRCSAGATITYLYDNRNNSVRKYEKLVKLQRNADLILDEFEKFGEVRLSESRLMNGLHYCQTNQRFADAERDRVKDRLLARGGICVGDGLYVRRSDPRARTAVRSLVGQIVADIKSVAAVVKTSDAYGVLDEYKAYGGIDAAVAGLIAAEAGGAS